MQLDQKITLSETSILLNKTAKKIAPLWSLENFVAVNPYLGMADKEFSKAMDFLNKSSQVNATLPVSFYLNALREGKMTRAHIAEVLEHNNYGLHDNADQHVVSVILDGENAWEYYPRNGCLCLTSLYKRLADHPRLHLTTFSEALSGQRAAAQSLRGMVAGSWVYGTFSTWIGDPDKNRAWEMLVEAKHAYDRVMEKGRLDDKVKAECVLQLARCEGSDWFWWFGDYNPYDSVRAFDEQYRLHLSNLYQCLQLEPPEYLSHTFTRGGGEPAAGGVMRRGQFTG